MSEESIQVVQLVEPTPPGELLPTPTAEQVQAADQLFAPAEQRNAALDLIGIVGTAQVLHDLAVDATHRKENSEKRINLPSGGR